MYWWVWVNAAVLLYSAWWGNSQWRSARRWQAAAREYERRVHDLLARGSDPQGE